MSRESSQLHALAITEQICSLSLQRIAGEAANVIYFVRFLFSLLDNVDLNICHAYWILKRNRKIFHEGEK